MIINEFLPDPTGADAKSEWIELFNSSKSSIDLSGWKLQNSKGSKFVLHSKVMGPQEYLLLPRIETKLTLKNQDEAISLYDAQGSLVDSANFLGVAQSGKSFNRVEIGGKPTFMLGDPTPAAKNKPSSEALVERDSYQAGQVFNNSLSRPQFFELMLGSATLITIAIIFIIKSDEKISNLLFKRN